ncbi:MAG: hypothetical protein NTY53_22415 [Kiritimatiellaeota bacterium]|nr:hypothetical protein [Kiritimatiellota bacterium]
MAEALSRLLGRLHSLRLWLLTLALVAGAAGCATPGGDSDLPWNMQQPWETAPSIPGFGPP